MFKRSNLHNQDTPTDITFTWDGCSLIGREGDSVAAALLGAGVRATREHPVNQDPRAPFCMMGTCFECLVEIDGIPNRQSCQVKLTEGMNIHPQRGARV